MNPNFMDLARVVSLQSDFSIKVGAVIVKSGKPISVGYNRIYSHPKKCFGKSCTIHAEVAALTRCPPLIRGANIYVFRQRKDGAPALARPCINCWQMLKEFGVKKVYYSIGEYPYFAVERI